MSAGVEDISFIEPELALPGAGVELGAWIDGSALPAELPEVEATFEGTGLEDVVAFFEDDLGGEAVIRFRSLHLTAGEGIAGFEGILGIEVLLTSAAGGPADPVILVDCRAELGCPLRGTELDLPSGTDANLITYLRVGAPSFTVRFRGGIAPAEWRVRVEGHLAAEISASYP